MAGQGAAAQIFFVVGYMKSGTTWLQLLLDSHPQVSCRGEGHLWNIFGEGLAQLIEGYNKEQAWLGETTFRGLPSFPKIEEQDAIALMRLLAVRLLTKGLDTKQIKAFGEKTPNHVKYLDSIHLSFPQARFVHIVRDGRDAALSGWHHYKRLKPEELETKWGADFHRWAVSAAHQWVRETGMARQAAEKYPGRLLELRYEDLLEAPDAPVARLFQFLGVDAAPETVRAALAASDFESLSQGRKRGEEDTASFFRKGVAGEWRAGFPEATLAAYNEIAGPTLTGYGYEV